MKEPHLLGTMCVYDFGLAASSLSRQARSQFVQKCYGFRVRRYNGDVYSILRAPRSRATVAIPFALMCTIIAIGSICPVKMTTYTGIVQSIAVQAWSKLSLDHHTPEGAVFNCEAVKPISFFWISQPS